MNLTLRNFRVLVGSLVLTTHFGCIGIVLYHTISSYNISEILTFVSAVAPITGLYAYTYWPVSYTHLTLPTILLV